MLLSDREDASLDEGLLDSGEEEKEDRLLMELLSDWLWEDAASDEAESSPFLQPDTTSIHKVAAMHKARARFNN